MEGYFTSLSGEKSSTTNLEYLAARLAYSSFSQSSFTCQNNHFKADNKGYLTAMRFDLSDIHQPDVLSKAYYKFKLGVKGFITILHIYAVIPSVDDFKYIEQCRYGDFRSGLHYGPVVWKLEVMQDSQRDVTTPDLKKIIEPILQSHDAKYNYTLVLVFEWKEFLVGNEVKNYKHVFEGHMRLEYKNKQPGMTYIFKFFFLYRAIGEEVRLVITPRIVLMVVRPYVKKPSLLGNVCKKGRKE